MCVDVLKMTIWQTPAGIVDEGGMLLGAWLNFGLSLEAPPANGLMHVSPTRHPPDLSKEGLHTMNRQHAGPLESENMAALKSSGAYL